MATRDENMNVLKDPKASTGQENSESVDRKKSSDTSNEDDGENQVSNETQSVPREPGIAKVGNTGPNDTE